MTEPGVTIKKQMLANQWFFLLLVVVILSIIAGTINSRYWWLGNLSNLLGQISVLSLVACGATVLIISGNFDISVGANIGLSSVVMAMLMRNGVFPPLAACIGVLISLICASLIGAASILFQAPSFIISLAAIGVFLLVFLSTFPVVIPFMFVGNAWLALRISNAVAVGMLFLSGYALGRHSGTSPWKVGLAMIALGVMLVLVALALGG